MRTRSMVLALALSPVLVPHAGATGAPPSTAAYTRMVDRVAALPGDERAQQLVGRRGLEILNVLWEDTGRWEGSSLGPNISDVTIEVQSRDARGRTRTALMPVVRHPNFTDKTGDIAADKLFVPVGNQAAGGQLSYVSLRELLADPARYMSLPDKGRIKGGTLLAKRDSHVLVSAQSTLLPVPKEGTATFWPVIFNYQSSKRHPAVLTMLVTRQGTSITVVDNARDTLTSESWGQRLFFNSGGQKAPLTAERLSTVKQNGVTSNGESAASLGADANLLMLVQVPLRVRQPVRKAMAMKSAEGVGGLAEEKAAAAPASRASSRSDVEVAVLGHGPEMGPYTELAGLTIERDPRFPVRVTVQFYQATSNGVLSAGDVRLFAEQIRKVYRQADYVGSLVAPSPADRQRPTSWDGVGPRPAGVTTESFPGLVERRR